LTTLPDPHSLAFAFDPISGSVMNSSRSESWKVSCSIWGPEQGTQLILISYGTRAIIIVDIVIVEQQE